MLTGDVADGTRCCVLGVPGRELAACPPGRGLPSAGSERDRDARLVLRVQEGDLSAFEELIEHYKQRLVNFAARAIRDPSEAQDIAQKAFLQVFRSIQCFRFTARFSTWLFAITRNLCLNELRRRARHPAEPLEADRENRERPLPAGLAQEPAVWAGLLETELLDQLTQALAALPERQRTALLLLREEDVSYEDIAAILGTTLPATKSLIHHGRRRLRRLLGRYLERGLEEREPEAKDRRCRAEHSRRSAPDSKWFAPGVARLHHLKAGTMLRS